MCVTDIKTSTNLGCDIFLIRYEKSGNEELALSLAQWVFKKRGVLRYSDVKHRLQGESEPPIAYTIADDVVCHFTCMMLLY
jgi:hypothetical protein